MITVELEIYQRGKKGTEKKLLNLVNAARPSRLFKIPSFLPRFTCTAHNGFGVDMISTFLYPLAPASPALSNMV